MPLILSHPFRSLARVDRLLRGEDRGRKPYRIRDILAVLVIFGGCYGAVMGTYGGMQSAHWRQMFYSAVKVPLLLSVTFCLSLPSFYVLNSLLGLRQDFDRAISAVFGAQAVLSVSLAALAPFSAFVYLCGINYDDAILFNGVMFAIASFGGQFALRRSFRPLVARDRRHRWTLRAWLAIYVFVGIQMGWTLRPFIGNPYMPTRFLRSEAISNAYVAVARILWKSIQ
jgi:uncharacterized membrane protein YoaK (UPF0700 family)